MTHVEHLKMTQKTQNDEKITQKDINDTKRPEWYRMTQNAKNDTFNTNDRKMKHDDSREKIRTKMTQNDDEMMPKCPQNNTKCR
jgi:hypothetical protein